MPMNDDEIIRARLLVDERPLKRLIKKFYQIASCPVEELDTTYAQFILDLDAQSSLNNTKHQGLSHVSSLEISSYQSEISRIESETLSSEREIQSLKLQLISAQQQRKNKIVYDGIAKEALKLPSRAHSMENIKRLTAELQGLEAEQNRYAETWEFRKDGFNAIVRSLEELGEKVREEKSEQERREALGEEEEDTADENKESITVFMNDNNDNQEGETSEKRNPTGKGLDPAARSFEPSPLGQTSTSANALDTASPLPSTTKPESSNPDLPDVVSESAPSMDVDEDGEVVMELLDEEKRKAKERAMRKVKKGDKRDRGDREEGEEEEGEGEGDGEDTEMQEA